MSHLFRRPTGRIWLRDRQREWKRVGERPLLLISQGFSHGLGWRGDGGNEADDESLRKNKNKQTEAAK